MQIESCDCIYSGFNSPFPCKFHLRNDYMKLLHNPICPTCGKEFGTIGLVLLHKKNKHGLSKLEQLFLDYIERDD